MRSAGGKSMRDEGVQHTTECDEGRDVMSRPSYPIWIRSEVPYGFFVVVSILWVVSIFAAVSVAAGAGAGAVAGVVVSLFAFSDLAHAATASTAAMRARRFM
jgi:hypothetical protein